MPAPFPNRKPRALFVLSPWAFDNIYGPELRGEIAQRVDVLADPIAGDKVINHPDLLAKTDLILSGWGGPRLDANLLALLPDLRAVFYGAGSIRGIVSDAFWTRAIPIVSAWAANAVPVSEYTLATILLSLKRFWTYAGEVKRLGHYPGTQPVAGGFGSTVGLVSLGMIGRRVAELLRPFDVKVIAYDPHFAPADAAGLGVELVSLDEVFRRSDVVSLHTPWLPETEGLVTGAHFESMKPHATFINTARGAVVREPEMIAALQRRTDLHAVLDVTHPEPPSAGSPLYSLPNVTLTPHIAGAVGPECRRLGRYMIEELDRWLVGQPLRWQVSKERAQTMA
ncbi:MAG: hydroxyacid dehydrogenase [Planctomycetota bacterium]|nr:hydroxyacid dehydrogenase [Planctomycetota bacterium]